LGFRDLLYLTAGCIRNTSEPAIAEQLRAAAHDPAPRLKFAFKFPFRAHERLHASQNAAALMVEPDIVDIRVSGDSIQRILVVGCSE
jgi:hypothetical protein